MRLVRLLAIIPSTDDPFHRNPSLDFVASPALAPPEVVVDAALMDTYNKELEEVSNTPLFSIDPL